MADKPHIPPVYQPHGPERCATCGENLSPDTVPSYSLVEWDGTGNVLVGMFCLQHPPLVAPLPDAPAPKEAP